MSMIGVHRGTWIAAVAFSVCLVASAETLAQDWPQWRGAARDGAAQGFTPPNEWPEKLVPVWKVPVGEGHSSPVVAGRQVYLMTRQNDDEVVSSISLETGRLLWRDRYGVPYAMNPAATSHGKGPKSTPVVKDGRLYTLGITGILSCYDASTGKLQWRREFSKQFKSTSPLYGTAMSTLVHNGMVIAHVGGHDSGALSAFDSRSGELRWSWNGDGPGYASPIVIVAAGIEQVVTQSQKSVVAVSASNGDLLWRIPFETEYVQNIVTPVWYRDLLILSGLDKGTTAIRPIKRGNRWETEQAWRNEEISMYMNSPVVVGDYLYGLSHKRKGQLFCVDARTGKTQWLTEGREGDNAAIVAAGQVLFILTDDAELAAARVNSKQFDLLKKYSVATSSTWAHPALVSRRLLVKDSSSLTMFLLD